MGQRSRAGQTSCTLFYPGAPQARTGCSRGRFTLSVSGAGAFFSSITLLWGLGSAAAQAPSSNCTKWLQAQDAKAVAACKAQVDEAESAPVTEHMARIVADDEYGVALLAIAHQPKQALEAFDRGIALLPASTVKPDSLQWAVAFWHRATAYQQLGQWQQAAGDLGTAEDTLSKGIAAAAGNAPLAQHLTQLRQRVRTQRTDVLERLGKHSEAQSVRATQ
jgi:tetratricopeptide (TPR) repeat protein